MKPAKYVVMLMRNGDEQAFVFAHSQSHQDMAAALQLLHEGSEPVSAGYVTMDATGCIRLCGGCVIMGLYTRAQDYAVLNPLFVQTDKADLSELRIRPRATAAAILGMRQPNESLTARGLSFRGERVAVHNIQKTCNGSVLVPSEVSE